MSMDHTHKKRHRIPTSCSVCRKRKSKCDRIKPVCGLCKKKSIAHLCFYESETKGTGGLGDSREAGAVADVGDEMGDYIQPPIGYHEQPSQMFHFQQPASDIPTMEGAYRRMTMGEGDPMFPQHGSMYDSNIYQYPLTDAPLGFTNEISDENNNIERIPERKQISNSYHGSVSYGSSGIPSFPSSRVTNTHASSGNVRGSSDLVSIFVGLNSTLNINPNDTIESYSDADSHLSNQGELLQMSGALSYVGLAKSDKYMLILRKYVYSLYKSGELENFLNSEKEPEDDTLEDALAAHDGDGSGSAHGGMDIDTEVTYDQDNNINGASSKHWVKSNKRNGHSKGEVDFELLVDSLKSTDLKQTRFRVAEKAILKILPNKLICRRVLGLFYKFIHPFVPVITESLLIDELSRIFAEDFYQESTEKYNSVTIKSDDDLYAIGILFLLLQLGHMSLIHNEESMVLRDNTEKLVIESKTMLDDLTMDKMAQLCTQDLMASRSSLQLVQFLTILYFYRSVHPLKSDGIGGTNNRNLFGIALQHALSIGLNRDPTLFRSQANIINNEAVIETRRSLWHYFVVTDSFASMSAGMPSQLTDLGMADTLFPSCAAKDQDIKYYVETLQVVSASYRNILAKLNNVQVKPKVIDILSETKKLEARFYDFFGKEFFKDYVCKPAHEQFVSSQEGDKDVHASKVMKVQKYLLFIHLRTSLTCIYFVIAMYYENNVNTSSMEAGITIFKICLKSVVQLVYVMSYTLENSAFSFGQNFDCVLTAENEKCIVKIHSLYSSYFVRMLHNRFILTTEELDQERLDTMDRVFMMILMKSDLFLGSLTKLSERYACAYQLSLIAFFVLAQWMKGSDQFFLELSNHSQTDLSSNMIQYCNIDEMEYISKLVQEFKNAKVVQNKSIRTYMKDRISKENDKEAHNSSTTDKGLDKQDQEQDIFSDPSFEDGLFSKDIQDLLMSCSTILKRSLISNEELFNFVEEIGNIGDP